MTPPDFALELVRAALVGTEGAQPAAPISVADWPWALYGAPDYLVQRVDPRTEQPGTYCEITPRQAETYNAAREAGVSIPAALRRANLPPLRPECPPFPPDDHAGVPPVAGSPPSSSATPSTADDGARPPRGRAPRRDRPPRPPRPPRAPRRARAPRSPRARRPSRPPRPPRAPRTARPPRPPRPPRKRKDESTNWCEVTMLNDATPHVVRAIVIPAGSSPAAWNAREGNAAEAKLSEIFGASLRRSDAGNAIIPAGPRGICDYSACGGAGAPALKKLFDALPASWRVTDQQIADTAAARSPRPRAARRAPSPPPPPPPDLVPAPPTPAPPAPEGTTYVRWIPDRNYPRVDGMPDELWLRFGTTPNGEGYPGHWFLTYASVTPPRRDN